MGCGEYPGYSEGLEFRCNDDGTVTEVWCRPGRAHDRSGTEKVQATLYCRSTPKGRAWEYIENPGAIYLGGTDCVEDRGSPKNKKLQCKKNKRKKNYLCPLSYSFLKKMGSFGWG